jgi:alginate O-acetyltransferase complex protein AlgI
MLFNSATFIFVFLPIVMVGFLVFTKVGWGRASVLWLSVASIAFYGWWNATYVPLLLASIGFNYLLGRLLSRRPSVTFFLLGVALNLVLLGYYKYTEFFIHAADQMAGLDWVAPHITLPLAISFFTFQQIAYLSDAHDGAAVEHDFLNYCLFISFFPHLIAGPITHHREMLPQFGRLMSGQGEIGRGSVGLTLFLIGLFKKVVLADPFGSYARPVFALASGGQVPQFDAAWAGALSYALQIYFDFSGYTDMAIGLGLLFGISLPPNFDSPFKARNIIEFWSRWHMTLTRFLTAYVYNPIVLHMTRARSRRGLPMPRRGNMTPGAFVMLVALPSVLTMFVSGFWHGAGWQFIVFGLLHGLYLAVNHGWRAIKAARGWAVDGGGWIAHTASVLLTFLCVLIGLVFFRASSVGAALNLLHGMVSGLPIEPTPLIKLSEAIWIFVMLLAVWFLPNPTQWMRHYRTALDAKPTPSWLERLSPVTTWRPSPAFGCIIGAVGMLTLMRALSAAPTEFLYFQF